MSYETQFRTAKFLTIGNEEYIDIGEGEPIKKSEFKDVTKKLRYVWIAFMKIDDRPMEILSYCNKSRATVENKNFLQMCEGENGEVIDENFIKSKMKHYKQDYKFVDGETYDLDFYSTGWIKARINPAKDPMRDGFLAAPYQLKKGKYPIYLPTMRLTGTVSKESKCIIDYLGGFILIPKKGPNAGKVIGMLDSDFIASFDMRAFPRYMSSGNKEKREELEMYLDSMNGKPSDSDILFMAGFRAKGKRLSERVGRERAEREDDQVENNKVEASPSKEPVKQASKSKDANMLLAGLGKLGKKAPEPVKESAPVKEKASIKEVVPEVKERKSRSKHYNIVGRYCENGVQIVAWELQATDESRSFICAKDTLAFLAGKGLVDNCKGVGIRGYKTLEDGTREAQGAYFIGKDCNLASLPVFDNVTKKFRNTDGVGHVRRDDTATSVMNKVLLIGVVKHGRVIDGYVAKNSAGAKRFLSREEVIRRAKEGKIGNARVQQYNGRDLLRSIKGQGELESLPLMDKDGNLVEV